LLVVQENGNAKQKEGERGDTIATEERTSAINIKHQMKNGEQPRRKKRNRKRKKKINK
jgi:hypothetical protein